MPDMSRAPILSGVNQAIEWTWLAPRSKRSGIKRKLAMTSRTSASIGKRRPLPAHRAERVRAGPRSKMQANRSSRSSFLKVTVRSALLKPAVPERLGARSPCTPESRCWRCLQHASERRRMSSRTPIAIDRALRGPIRKECARWADAARAISVCPKPIWAMWPLLPPSMSFN